MTTSKSLLLAALVSLQISSPAAVFGQAEDAAALRVLQEAQRQERNGEIAEAESSYNLVVENFPRSRQAEEALLALAATNWRSGKSRQAKGFLERLIDEYPESPRAATGSVLQAHYITLEARSVQNLEEARTLLSRVPLLYGADEYPNLEARVRARVENGEINLLLGDAATASVDFLAAIEDENASQWLPRARFGLAQSMLAGGEWAAAADILQRVVDRTGEDSELAARSRRLLAFIHRHWLRPSLGQSPWSTARVVQLQGAALKKPSRIAAAQDGRLLVIDPGTKIAAVFSADGRLLKSTPANRARDGFWGADGQPYALLPDSARNLETGVSIGFAWADNKERIAKNIGAGQLGPFGDFLLVDRDKKTLMVFDPSAYFMFAIRADEVVDIDRAPHGRTLLLDRKRRRVSSYGLDFEEISGFTGSWKRAAALSSDASGNLYVLDAADSKVTMLDPSGGSRGSIGPSLPGGIQLRGAEDLTIDGEGRLYLVDTKLGQIIVLE